MVSKQLLQCLDISNVNIPFWSIVIAGEQGWHNGESTRLMARVQIPASTPLVVSSLPCSERFLSEYSGFPLS